jgi:hypothetical protein
LFAPLRQQTSAKNTSEEGIVHWYLFSSLEAASNADTGVSPVPRVLVHSGNADRDWELLREEAEAEREPILLMEATEIKHRYAMEMEATVERETILRVPIVVKLAAPKLDLFAACLSSMVTLVGVPFAEIAPLVVLALRRVRNRQAAR